MPKLASLLETTDDGPPRGPDLRATVTVPTSALGLSSGTVVRIPMELPYEGAHLARTPAPHDDGDRVQLHLPANLADGSTLRLVGQGASADGGRPGDLYITITLESRPRSPRLVWFLLGITLGLLVFVLLKYCIL